MTRDEAIKIVERTLGTSDKNVDTLHVDTLVALGVLKLDEPRGPNQKFRDTW